MKKILTGATISIIILIFALSFFNRNTIKLKLMGYDSKTINIIKKKLTKENMSTIVNTTKIENLYDLLTNENFNADNLDDYILLLNNKFNVENTIYIISNNQKISYNIITDIVNNDTYDNTKLQRYVDYYLKNNNVDIDNIILIVNNEVDTEDIDYSDILINLINSKYYVKANIKRYLNYYNNNKDIPIDKTVSIVNTKSDYEYYTNTIKTDVTKNNLMLVNKFYYLGSNYIPDNLVTIESKYGYKYKLQKDAYEHYKAMWESASEESLSLFATSPYRSYSTQDYLYNNYVKNYGKAEAERFSARAGYSEHQTGLAIDIVKKGGTFGEFEYTMEYRWLLENAHKFGFIMRYPNGKEDLTGYMFESWHYRYVGVDVATKIFSLGITFDEYYEYYLK